MEDKMMICFYHSMNADDEPKRICAFYTTSFSEYLKLFDYAKKHEICLYPHELSGIPEEVKEHMDGLGTYIEDFSIRFGGNDCVQCIDVYLS